MNPGEFVHLSRNEERLWWFRGMRRIFDLLQRRYCGSPPGARVLEAGCGTGFEAARIARNQGWRILPIDLSDAAVKAARARGLDVTAANIVSLPFADTAFDGLVSLDVIVHLDAARQAAALREFHRVLRPGGWLAMRAAAFGFLRSKHSEWVGETHRVRLPELRAAAESAGFRIRFASYANTMLLPVAIAKFRLWEPLTGATPASGVEMPSPWLNRLLEVPLRVECLCFRSGMRMPVGQSVYLFAEKP
jgi:SAM-dependent methyltransferase